MAFLFDEILLDPDLITMWGSGSPEFANTTIKNQGSGISKVNVNRFDAKEVWSVDLELMTPANRAYLMKMWRGGYGNAVGFRVRVPTDYTATLEAFAVGTGAALTFQLYKTYTRPGVTARQDVRKIIKPVVVSTRETNAVVLKEPDGTTTRTITNPFRIYVNNVEILTATWKVNAYTGLVTFTGTPPANGHTIAWSGEFDTPMRFVPNSFQQKFDVASEVRGLGLEEILPAELGL